MTVEHSDHEVVGGAHRSIQQLVFTATQLVEVIARTRAQTQTRQADADRAAAATDTAAADRVRRDRTEQRAAITQDRQQWAPVSDPGWRRDAGPEQLLTAWAAATTWAGHDPAAAAAMTRTEAEIRHRWPELGDHYDQLRVTDGLHPAAAMSLAVREAAAAGWDPTETADNPPLAEAAADTARERQGRAGQEQHRAAGTAATTPDNPTTPRIEQYTEGLQQAGDRTGAAATAQAGTAAELALKWHPPVGSTPESRLTDHGPADRGQTGRLSREPRSTTPRNSDAAPRSR